MSCRLVSDREAAWLVKEHWFGTGGGPGPTTDDDSEQTNSLLCIETVRCQVVSKDPRLFVTVLRC